jgi:hypothetical protein
MNDSVFSLFVELGLVVFSNILGCTGFLCKKCFPAIKGLIWGR